MVVVVAERDNLGKGAGLDFWRAGFRVVVQQLFFFFCCRSSGGLGAWGGKSSGDDQQAGRGRGEEQAFGAALGGPRRPASTRALNFFFFLHASYWSAGPGN